MKYNLDILSQTLSNGMEVVLVHKKDYQKSLFCIGIPAGGFNIEEIKDGKHVTNRTGVAHFLEHQMFRLNGKDVTEEFAKMQAQANAFTSYTETCYYFMTTANPLKPLGLLMDMVQNLDVTKQSVDKEKGIILSEYSIYDQQPENQMIRQIFNSLYEKHPLKTEILGTPEDIQKMEMEDLMKFYNTNYDPSRLVLVGVTGKDLGPIMDFIEKKEENYPSKENKNPSRFFDDEPERVNREYYSKNMDITEPYVIIGYKLKPVKGIMKAMKEDLMVSLWLDASFGPLNPDYQKWIDEKIFSNGASTEADLDIDHAYICFWAQTRKKEEFIQLVDSLVKHRKISREAFDALKIQAIARNLRGLDHFENMATDLIRSKFLGFDYVEALDLAKNLDYDEVNAFIEGLDLSHRAIVEILPENEQDGK